ncbi:hypothetical protein CALVIDRAFT_409699 [Calocera viscosa TUFC12733]|uniref:Uncharacterized protein n=1 Tax=Calocera viscosa (strain TUFC12733) TaxID=1330018 RepID=A0A167G8D9_CALVF|nr:hypothetical protein CALVIDRAFT_409699 [Calocera viscosa TUFC12733]
MCGQLQHGDTSGLGSASDQTGVTRARVGMNVGTMLKAAPNVTPRKFHSSAQGRRFPSVGRDASALPRDASRFPPTVTPCLKHSRMLTDVVHSRITR